MTRLLRVSRHVHDEAEEVLCKEFMFPFNLSRADKEADTTVLSLCPWLQELCPTSAHIYTNHPGYWRQYFETR